MEGALQLLVTSDGSTTLFNRRLQEVYHSRNGALTESMHVFIQSGFLGIAGLRSPVNILEIGFGTGLNALLTLRESKRINIPVIYTALEPEPLPVDVIGMLNYPELPGLEEYRDAFYKMHSCNTGICCVIRDHFSLLTLKTGLDETNLPANHFDLIYFDAFSPDVQPVLWSANMMKKLFDTTRTRGFLVTYSAKGLVRRNLQSAGWRVNRLPGPPGKREMIRAIKDPHDLSIRNQ